MNVAIVEDETTVARKLARDVRGILRDRIRQMAIFGTLPEASVGIHALDLDVVFLDLNVNGKDGFELLTDAVASRFHTIVVSAHEDQAIRAFEYGVVDFVPKPWTELRLRQAIERAVGVVADEREAGRARWLAVRRAGRVDLVPLERVRAIKGADDYTELRLDDGSRLLHEKTLADLDRLLPATFARVHRSWIVRLDCVRAFSSAEGGRGVLELDDLRVPVGRTYRGTVAEQLKRNAV